MTREGLKQLARMEMTRNRIVELQIDTLDRQNTIAAYTMLYKNGDMVGIEKLQRLRGCEI